MKLNDINGDDDNSDDDICQVRFFLLFTSDILQHFKAYYISEFQLQVL